MANNRFNKQVSPKGYEEGGKVKKPFKISPNLIEAVSSKSRKKLGKNATSKQIAKVTAKQLKKITKGLK